MTDNLNSTPADELNDNYWRLREQIASLKAKHFTRYIELQQYDSFSALASNDEHFLDSVMDLVQAELAKARTQGAIDEINRKISLHIDVMTSADFKAGFSAALDQIDAADKLRLAELKTALKDGAKGTE